MYCKHCGKEIDNNSIYCNHCGKPQGKTQKEISNKPILLVGIIWALANLYLLMGNKEDDTSSFFYPFTNHSSSFIFIEGNLYDGYYYYCWDKNYYDFSEFIVYVFIIPAILFVIYRRYNEKIDKFVNKLLNKK